MPMIKLDDETEKILTRLRSIGNYSSRSEALEDSIKDFYEYIILQYTRKD